MTKSSVLNCLITNDATTGPRGIPNCRCLEKFPETPLVEYKFNNCGYRTTIECGTPKSPDTYRIVMTGASFAMGLRVPQEKSFAALLPQELSRETGRKVELYNVAMRSGNAHVLDLRFNDALAEHPDLIIWAMSAFEIENAAKVIDDPAPAKRPATPGSSFDKLVAKIRSVPDLLQYRWDRSRTSLLVQHYLYESQTQYVKLYLMRGDKDAGFLNARFSPGWQTNLKQFDLYASDMLERAKAAGVPMVVILLPPRSQAAIASMGEWPPNIDPYKLGEEVGPIVTGHGGIFIDLTHDYRNIPNAERYFFPVELHPTVEGQALISEFLTQALTSGVVPALKANQPTTTKQAQ
jgi:hypothetical protein